MYMLMKKHGVTVRIEENVGVEFINMEKMKMVVEDFDSE